MASFSSDSSRFHFGVFMFMTRILRLASSKRPSMLQCNETACNEFARQYIHPVRGEIHTATAGHCNSTVCCNQVNFNSRPGLPAWHKCKEFSRFFVPHALPLAKPFSDLQRRLCAFAAFQARSDSKHPAVCGQDGRSRPQCCCHGARNWP